jgi:protein-L-isoaspartate(D-aspartate) O-methyltransferase
MGPYKPPFPSVAAQARAQARAQAMAKLLLRLRAKGFRDLTLLRALESAPRENFVGPGQVHLAMRDIALPLPCGQTIERPSDLALTLAALAVEPHMRVLEIGTGSGYSAAVLGHLARDVVSLECFDLLARAAREKMDRLGIKNVAALWADGFEISPGLGLFDRIVVHGAVDAPPPNLLGALGEGGVLIVARSRDDKAERLAHRRLPGDRIAVENLGPCRAQELLRGLFSGL